MDQGVGGVIKKLREERDWSQAKLAVEAEMSVSGVSMIENGQRNLTTTTLAKLAKAFGVEIGDLFPKAQSPLPLPESPQGAPQENYLRELQEQGNEMLRQVLVPWRVSPLAESLMATTSSWLKNLSDIPADNTTGAVYFALDVDDRLSVLMGDEERWGRLSQRERSEILHIMGMIEDLASQHIDRMEADMGRSEPPADLEEFRRRREQLRERRLRVGVETA